MGVVRKYQYIFATLFLAPVISFANVCDTAWNADNIVRLNNAYPGYLRLPLNDRDNHSLDEVTLAQVRAFSVAKERISRVAGLSPKLLICSSKEPNAFAIPTEDGDVVGVTIGMLKLVDGDQDMAAEIVGHEIAHHTKHHIATSAANDSLLNILGLVIGVALEQKIVNKTGKQGLGLDLGLMGAALVSRKFSRDHEREADSVGFQYLVAAGFNPEGAVRLSQKFDRLGSNGIGLFYDSHPGWEEREVLFRTMIAGSTEAQRLIASAGTRPSTNEKDKTQGNNRLAAIDATYKTTDAQKSFEDSISAYYQKDYPAAVSRAKASAELGYAHAQVLLGYLYLQGLGGLTKDDAEAARYFKLSAEQGNASGQSNLGLMYLQGRGGLTKDDAEAVRYFKLAAAQGNANGQTSLGAMYVQGRGGLAKDEVEAVRYFKLSAEQGNAPGQANLGFAYEYGRGGLVKDDVEAIRLYKVAAQQGDPAALASLKRRNIQF